MSDARKRAAAAAGKATEASAGRGLRLVAADGSGRKQGRTEEVGALGLPALSYQRLRVFLEAEEAAELPPFKGSLLRGGLGTALKGLVCAWSHGDGAPECRECPLRDGCAYTRLFEPFVETAPGGEVPQGYRGVETAPRPYVIEPFGESHTSFRAGDLLGFDLLLFGRAVELGGAAAVAISRMADTGLGAGRARFRLSHVLVQSADGAWQAACDAPHQSGHRKWLAPTVGVPVPAARGEESPKGWTLFLETPLYLRRRGRTLSSFGFPTLVEAALRRVRDLAAFYGDAPDQHPDTLTASGERRIVELARRVRVTESRLGLRSIRRYSNRQKRSLYLQGVVGELHLRGPVAPLLPLLRAVEVLHLGKATTFGLGKIRLQALEETTP